MMMDEFPGGWPFSATRSPSWLNPRSSTYMEPQYNYYYPRHRSFNDHFSPFGWDPIYADGLPLTRRKPKHPSAQNRRMQQNKKPNTNMPASMKQPKPEDNMSTTAMESDQLNVTPITPEMVLPSSPSATESVSSENNKEPTDFLNDELESGLLSSDDARVDTTNSPTASQHSNEDEQDHVLSKDVEDCLAAVEGVKQKAEQLKEQVNSFAGQKGTKEFVFLDESLLSLLLELDKVETMGCTDIRQARKTTVLMIQELHSILESRAVNNVN